MLKYVVQEKIVNLNQLEVGISKLKADTTDSMSEKEFEEKAGIGIIYTKECIRKQTQELINKYKEVILIERYRFKIVGLLNELKEHFIYIDGTLAKLILEEEFENIVGLKTSEDIYEEKLRAQAEGNIITQS